MIAISRQCCFTLIVTYLIRSLDSQWLTKEVAIWAIAEFKMLETIRSQLHHKGADRRPSAPFITGDGFRDFCPHICEEENRCRMSPESVTNGQCIFVKSDFFDHFAKNIVQRINATYIAVVHNGDLSAPDGQTDAPKTQLGKHYTSHIFQKEYDDGRLLALHTQNLWWRNITKSPRPAYAHCLPIGCVHNFTPAPNTKFLRENEYSNV